MYSDKLKYLPVEFVRTQRPGGETFRVDLGEYLGESMSLEFSIFLMRGLKELRLLIQRKYRKQIRESGRTFDDFILEVIEDETAVYEPDSDVVGSYSLPGGKYYVYCVLNLKEKDA